MKYENCVVFMNKKREIDFLNHGGRYHENVKSLCLN